LKDLKVALYELYSVVEQPTLDEIAAEVAGLADELDLPGIPKRDTIARIIGGTDVPANSADVVAVAAVLAHMAGRDVPTVVAQVRQLWVRARMAPAPPGAVRVRDARPRMLGVHAAIRVDDAPGGLPELPVYVPRDVDADLRTAITAAAADGGFVLLVGGSSVGKTRALYEAVRAVLPDWWLIRPGGSDEIRALAAGPTPRTVVWLDELQNYLADGLGVAAAVRTLLHAGVVLAGTLWPHEYATRATPRLPGQHDPHAADREVLGLAEVIDVPDTLSPAERRRAETLTGTDPRIRTAIDSPDYGFTQVLAAGPELVRWWEQAPDPYGKAVITAALDARRVGAHAPLTRNLLAAAAPSYLTPTHRATAPPDWLDNALTYATTALHGAAATLTPVGTELGQITGYAVADYLHQHARRTRRCEPLPDVAWQALVDHVHPDDAYYLGDSAERRMRYRHAEALYRHGADAGNFYAAERFAGLLAEQGRIDELRERAEALYRHGADADDCYAAERLAGRLAAEALADLLARQGRADELGERAEAGEEYAAYRLANLFAEQGRTDEATATLRQLVAAAGEHLELFLEQLVDLLAEQGRIDEAITVLQPRAESGDEYATYRLADLFAGQGRTDEAIAILRQYAGGGYPRGLLIRLLGEQGRTNELGERADAGENAAGEELADILARQGRTDVLRERADAGDHHAAARLATLLAKQGQTDELRRRTDAGDQAAAERLAESLAEQGHIDEAIAILRRRTGVGDRSAVKRLARLLAEQGHIDEAIAILREAADSGDRSAGDRLTALLAEHGYTDELRAEVHAGTPGAAARLAALTRVQGPVATEGAVRGQPE